MYAGNDYLTKQLNNVTQSTFEPGSTMKPFGLLGAAQEGVNFNTLFNGNSGLTFETTPGTTAQVPNALNTNWGYINLYQATANSVNTVFMEVNKHLGAANLAKIAHQAGIEGDIAEDTTYNILGINGITVWDLAQGHSTIANDGVKNTLHIVDKVLTSDGSKELYKTAQENQQVFEANDCHLVQKAMQGTTTYGTAAGVSARLGRQVAGPAVVTVATVVGILSVAVSAAVLIAVLRRIRRGLLGVLLDLRHLLALLCLGLLRASAPRAVRAADLAVVGRLGEGQHLLILQGERHELLKQMRRIAGGGNAIACERWHFLRAAVFRRIPNGPHIEQLWRIAYE